MDSHDVDCSKANRMHNSAALCSSTATADRNAVEAVLCKGHRRPCLIKTGVRDGPSKGKSYYVCSIRDGSCSHVSTATLAGTSHVTVCAVHGQPISLRSQSTTESPAVQYRCASNERTQWCESYSVMTFTDKENAPASNNPPACAPRAGYVSETKGSENARAETGAFFANASNGREGLGSHITTSSYVGSESVHVAGRAEPHTHTTLSISGGINDGCARPVSAAPSQSRTHDDTNSKTDIIVGLEDRLRMCLQRKKDAKTALEAKSIAVEIDKVHRSLSAARALCTTREDRPVQTHTHTHTHAHVGRNPGSVGVRASATPSMTGTTTASGPAADGQSAVKKEKKRENKCASGRRNAREDAVDSDGQLVDRDDLADKARVVLLRLGRARDIARGESASSLASTDKRRKDGGVVALPEISASLACVKTRLLPHQVEAVRWMMWREGSGGGNPRGGILGDDMGLGKSLDVIAVVMCSKAMHPATTKPTLVVCPASLLCQWASEVKAHTDGIAECVVYHGSNRTKKAKGASDSPFSGVDFVVTTYATLEREHRLHFKALEDAGEASLSDDSNGSADDDASAATNPNSPLFASQWARAVFDEGHVIRNKRTSSFAAAAAVADRSDARWIVTGTPVQNSLADVAAALQFLRVPVYGTAHGFKAVVSAARDAPAAARAVLASVMLRRTKDEMKDDGTPLVALPRKERVEHAVDMLPDEKRVYDAVVTWCRKFVAGEINGTSTATVRNKMLTPDAHSHSRYLVALTRLRQAACHVSLLKASVDSSLSEHLDGVFPLKGRKEKRQDDDLSAMFASLEVTKEAGVKREIAQVADGVDICVREARGVSVLDAVDAPSGKMNAMARIATEAAADGHMCVIVSQWTSMLDVAARRLSTEGFSLSRVDGGMTPARREAEITAFFHASSSLGTSSSKGRKVRHAMLLSLCAGGVGLNLTCASHVIMLDAHWNPAAADQAADRVHRLGQTADAVHIHTLLYRGTVDERCAKVQARKRSLARRVYRDTNAVSSSGAKRVTGKKEDSSAEATDNSSTNVAELIEMCGL